MGAIHTIVTHRRPHFDEILALWLLRTFGNEKYPGVQGAAVICWDAGSSPPDGRTAAEWEAEGFLCVGVGHGKLDEHPGGGAERKADECAATLAAKDLGVADDPALGQLLEFAKAADLEGKTQPLDLFSITKTMFLAEGDDEGALQKVVAWVTAALNAQYSVQRSFFGEGRAIFEQSGRVIELSPGEKLVVIEADIPSVLVYAQYKVRPRITIQRATGGHTRVFTYGKGRNLAGSIARAIRVEEQAVRGNSVTTDHRALMAEGTVPGAECWYFHRGGGMLLNGSLTARDVEPTRLSLERIVELVKSVMSAAQEKTAADRVALTLLKGG